jgi:hypothetical protein
MLTSIKSGPTWEQSEAGMMIFHSSSAFSWQDCTTWAFKYFPPAETSNLKTSTIMKPNLFFSFCCSSEIKGIIRKNGKIY